MRVDRSPKCAVLVYGSAVTDAVHAVPQYRIRQFLPQKRCIQADLLNTVPVHALFAACRKRQHTRLRLIHQHLP